MINRPATRQILAQALRMLAVIVVAVGLSSNHADASEWERISQPQTQVTQNVETSEQTSYIRTEVRDGYLYLSIERDAPVKVFTILGQLVTSQQLGAGRWRLPLKARGIYILKIGPVTRRVTY